MDIEQLPSFLQILMLCFNVLTPASSEVPYSCLLQFGGMRRRIRKKKKVKPMGWDKKS